MTAIKLKPVYPAIKTECNFPHYVGMSHITEHDDGTFTCNSCHVRLVAFDNVTHTRNNF